MFLRIGDSFTQNLFLRCKDQRLKDDRRIHFSYWQEVRQLEFSGNRIDYNYKMKTILNEKNVLRKLFKISILNQKKANFY
jgi:hypothetical protein